MKFVSKLLCLILTYSIILLPGCRSREEAPSDPASANYTAADGYKNLSKEDQQRFAAINKQMYEKIENGGWELYDYRKKKIDYSTYVNSADKGSIHYLVSPRSAPTSKAIAFQFVSTPTVSDKEWKLDTSVAVKTWPTLEPIGRYKLSMSSKDPVDKQKLAVLQGETYFASVFDKTPNLPAEVKKEGKSTFATLGLLMGTLLVVTGTKMVANKSAISKNVVFYGSIVAACLWLYGAYTLNNEQPSKS